MGALAMLLPARMLLLRRRVMRATKGSTIRTCGVRAECEEWLRGIIDCRAYTGDQGAVGSSAGLPEKRRETS